MREIRVEHAAGLTGAQVARVREIYQQAFEPDHQVPFAELVATGPVDMLLVAVEDDEPVGFAALRSLGADGWTFLRYYAIIAGRRGTGLGQRFWRLVQPAVEAVGWPARITFEVEDPEHVAGHGGREIAAARIAFWIRCGCQLLPVTGYVMPDFSDAPPEPMLLMASEAPPGVRETAELVRAIYAGRYRLGPEHPLVVAALASIAAGSAADPAY